LVEAATTEPPRGWGMNRRHGVTASGVLNGIIVVLWAGSIPQKGVSERVDPFGCMKYFINRTHERAHQAVDVEDKGDSKKRKGSGEEVEKARVWM